MRQWIAIDITIIKITRRKGFIRVFIYRNCIVGRGRRIIHSGHIDRHCVRGSAVFGSIMHFEIERCIG